MALPEIASAAVGSVAGVYDGDCTKGIREACKDSVAMLFMFDLTSCCTLNSVFNWYQQARKYNQMAIPVMVGSKFDDFIEIPIDMPWTISNEFFFTKILVPHNRKRGFILSPLRFFPKT